MAAFNAGPPSPLKSYSPFQATVWMFPVEATTSRMTALPTSAMNRYPEAFYVHRAWEIQCRAHRGSTVTAVPKCVIPGDRLYGAGCCHYFPDDTIAGVREEEIPRGIEKDTIGIGELGSLRRTAIAGIAGRASARDRLYVAGCRHDFPDHAVARVREQDISGAVQLEILRIIEGGACGGGDGPAGCTQHTRPRR